MEDGNWLVLAAGYGDRRPSRKAAEFDEFLAAMPDPAIADLTQHLKPVGDIAIYRQTGNRRNRYGRSRTWPAGLLAVGDACYCLQSVYGRGITVAACQALLIRRFEATARQRDARWRPGGYNAGSLQRLTCRGRSRRPRICVNRGPGTQSPIQRLVGLWTGRLAQLAAHGDRSAYLAFARVYHLMATPALLYHPDVIVSVVRAALRGMPEAAPRPAALNALAEPLNAG